MIADPMQRPRPAAPLKQCLPEDLSPPGASLRRGAGSVGEGCAAGAPHLHCPAHPGPDSSDRRRTAHRCRSGGQGGGLGVLQPDNRSGEVESELAAVAGGRSWLLMPTVNLTLAAEVFADLLLKGTLLGEVHGERFRANPTAPPSTS